MTSGLIIDTDKLTIADVFKNKGYATAALGKWHLGFGEGKTTGKNRCVPGRRISVLITTLVYLW